MNSSSTINIGSILSRDEMKNIMGGLICNCNYGDCSAHLVQGVTFWTLTLECGDDPVQNYNGPGEYGGTVCGGECPDWATPQEN